MFVFKTPFTANNRINNNVKHNLKRIEIRPRESEISIRSLKKIVLHFNRLIKGEMTFFVPSQSLKV